MPINPEQYVPEHPEVPTHLDLELGKLRQNLLGMWNLVISQVSKAEEALNYHDRNLAMEIKANEKRVDAFELNITLGCENILALFSPVAADLRFVLSVLKIAYNLERTGDYAKTIANIVLDLEKPLPPEVIKKSGVPAMFAVTLTMLHDIQRAFETGDSALSRVVFSKDEELDTINKGAYRTFTELIRENPEEISALLHLLSVVRRLERIGDQSKNIAEEIIFYLEADLIKHNKSKRKPHQEI